MKAFMFQKGGKILKYSDKDSILKIRQLSKNMREVVKFMMKERTLIVKKYNEKAQILCRKQKQKERECIACLDSKPGLQNFFVDSDYYLKLIKDLEEPIVELNLSITSREKEEFTIKNLRKLVANNTNSSFYFHLKFKFVKEFEINNVNSSTIDSVIELVDDAFSVKILYSPVNFKMLAKYPSLNNLELFSASIHSSEGRNDLAKEIEPYQKGFFKKLTSLTIKSCYAYEGIKCPNLTVLKLEFMFIDKQFGKWIGSHKKLKTIELKETKTDFLYQYLPLNLREIQLLNIVYQKARIELIIDRCPYFISFTSMVDQISLSEVENTTIRLLNCNLIDDFTNPVQLRLRYVYIDDSNIDLINNHPEIISKANHLKILTQRFNWKFLPGDLNRLSFDNVNEKGFFLTRLKEKCGETRRSYD